MTPNIYNNDKLYENAIRTLKEKEILEINKKHILEFEHHLKVILRLSIARRVKYLIILSECAKRLNKDFEKANKKDIENLVEGIDEDKHWSNSTKRDYKVLVKRFYKWLLENDEEYPFIVKWIKTTQRYNITVRKSELLTEQELEKVLSVSKNSRDKAFIHTLYESGGRIGEIGTLRIKDVIFDKYGCQINVKGKTGERPIRLVKSTSDLNFWYRHHPNKDDIEAPLWCHFDNPEKCLCYGAFKKILVTHFKLAGIKKRSNPHIFRHCRLTKLSQHLSDQELKIFAGWSKSSNMIEIYSHLTGEDVANKILEINGISQKENIVADKPILCPRCNCPNSKDTQFCYNCSQVLDETIAQNIAKQGNDIVNAIKSNPEAMKLLSQLSEVLNKG